MSECHNCIPNCQKCNDSTTCEVCLENHEPMTSDNQFSCVPICKSGLEYRQGQKCVQCESCQYCQVFSLDICSSCHKCQNECQFHLQEEKPDVLNVRLEGIKLIPNSFYQKLGFKSDKMYISELGESSIKFQLVKNIFNKVSGNEISEELVIPKSLVRTEFCRFTEEDLTIIISFYRARQMKEEEPEHPFVKEMNNVLASIQSLTAIFTFQTNAFYLMVEIINLNKLFGFSFLYYNKLEGVTKYMNFISRLENYQGSNNIIDGYIAVGEKNQKFFYQMSLYESFRMGEQFVAEYLVINSFEVMMYCVILFLNVFYLWFNKVRALIEFHRGLKESAKPLSDFKFQFSKLDYLILRLFQQGRFWVWVFWFMFVWLSERYHKLIFLIFSIVGPALSQIFLKCVLLCVKLPSSVLKLKIVLLTSLHSWVTVILVSSVWNRLMILPGEISRKKEALRIVGNKLKRLFKNNCKKKNITKIQSLENLFIESKEGNTKFRKVQSLTLKKESSFLEDGNPLGQGLKPKYESKNNYLWKSDFMFKTESGRVTEKNEKSENMKPSSFKTEETRKMEPIEELPKIAETKDEEAAKKEDTQKKTSEKKSPKRKKPQIQPRTFWENLKTEEKENLFKKLRIENPVQQSQPENEKHVDIVNVKSKKQREMKLLRKELKRLEGEHQLICRKSFRLMNVCATIFLIMAFNRYVLPKQITPIISLITSLVMFRHFNRGQKLYSLFYLINEGVFMQYILFLMFTRVDDESFSESYFLDFSFLLFFIFYILNIIVPKLGLFKIQSSKQSKQVTLKHTQNE